jgi:excisionase family DNA binding protein
VTADDVLTADEVAVLLRFGTVKTVYQGAREGSIPCVRVGRSYRFHKPTILAWLAGQVDRNPSPR